MWSHDSLSSVELLGKVIISVYSVVLLVCFLLFMSARENFYRHRRGHWNGQGGHCGTPYINTLMLSLATTRMGFGEDFVNKDKDIYVALMEILISAELWMQ